MSEKIGNTNSQSSRSKQSNQFIGWFFTFNNYNEESLLEHRLLLDRYCKRYIFQEETGNEGTIHLQGNMSLNKRMRLTELKKIFNEKIHWEPTKNSKAADKYCCKDETRTGRIWSNIKKKAFIRTKSKFDTLEPRKEIIDIIQKEPNNRTINWIWSENGGVGKTSTAAYIEKNYEGVCIVNGKGADIKNSVITHINNENPLDILIVNVPRCNENHLSYAAIEEIKDGLIYSGKYEGGFANIEHPHVIIISNFHPELNKLSEDRWNIINVDKD